MTATLDELGSLHATLARVMEKALKEEYRDENGNSVPPPPHLLKNVVDFLKNNRIEATGAPGTPTRELLEASVPFLPDYMNKRG